MKAVYNIRLQLLRDKIAEMMIPVMEIYEKLNNQSTARRQLQKDLDLIYKTTGTAVKDQMALHDSVQNLKRIKLDSARDLDSKEIKGKPELSRCDLYLMSEFDIKQCQGIKGTLVILTNKNIAYFIFEDNIVMKGDKPQAVEGIDRLEIKFSNATMPLKYNDSEQKKEKIINEAALKGGHIQISDEPKMFTILVNSFFSKVQADLTAKLTRNAQGSRLALALPAPAAPKEPIEVKSLDGMADVIAKIPGQPVTASVDLLFKDLTLTLSGLAPRTVDPLTPIADLKQQVSDLQSESLPPVSSEIQVSEPISPPTTGSQPVSVDPTITITPITPLVQDSMTATVPVKPVPVDPIALTIAPVTPLAQDSMPDYRPRYG